MLAQARHQVVAFARRLQGIDVVEQVGVLEHRPSKVGLRGLQENIDTTSSGGRLVFHLVGALAKFERKLTRERTRAGLVAARARGRMGGLPKRRDPVKLVRAVKLPRERNHTVEEICKMKGISTIGMRIFLRICVF
ncbi:recombinase family protein [Massilia frigida]|uniref:recombinase family protein n=1 Tax=Massilia frigida TaxID=2609281 RepID=UPI0016522CCE